MPETQKGQLMIWLWMALAAAFFSGYVLGVRHGYDHYKNNP